MNVSEVRKSFDAETAGAECHAWISEWFPINRSITGEGIRAQLRALGKLLLVSMQEVPTGTKVLDWTVPKEWNIRDAYVEDSTGRRVIDWKENNLHVLQYSVPVREKISLSELKKKITTLPDQPELIPYRTSYYKEQWGFCAAEDVVSALREGDYDVVIDSTLEKGHLTYGEVILPGESEDEVLISAHACHPSLANDNLSGLAVAAWLARALEEVERKFTYRFVFAPGTIGAITWLARNQRNVGRIRHGLILACLGDTGDIHYKRSRQGDATIDRAVEHALSTNGSLAAIADFTPYGYDERQYCSPGFNLPVGLFTRSQPGTFPEYHTSADNIDFVKPDALADSIEKLLAVFEIIEGDAVYTNLSPKGEPQLGKRGLYSNVGGSTEAKVFEMALLWVLNFSDGEHSLLDIAARAGIDFATIRRAADALIDAELLAEAEAAPQPIEIAPPPRKRASQTVIDDDDEEDEEETPASKRTRGPGRKQSNGPSPLQHAEAIDFWDDFIDGDPDLSNASLADYFKEEV